MVQVTVKIEGMACGMCEAHIKDTIRAAVPAARKLRASHAAGEAVFLCDEMPEEAALQAAIDNTGYRFLSMTAEPWHKKGFFGRE